ncbi:MAG: Asp-tRNA(Asn)/Glu-tRNA(Gln) amidotransferase subunit GatB [Anaerolineae bacterium]
MGYKAVIGMEVHAQILTRSKMFCACSADYAGAPPNSHTCPTCLGMPGALPTANKAAIEATIRTGLALSCQIPPYAKFDRKNYPYPDLPKGYQISQYDLPLCRDGHLAIHTDAGERIVRIRRVHLEEDTAKLIHQANATLIDYNRAGVPLMEIVTEADIRTAEEAWRYLLALRRILRYLGVSTGNMEEGAMRCEANVSVKPESTNELGTKVEIKNLNSFRAVRQAIAYEIQRQIEVLEAGGEVHQVTMGWDEDAHRTVFQRSKEYAEDYRYFPEPDLPPMVHDPSWIGELRDSLPELPASVTARFMELGMRPDDAELLAEDRAVASYIDSALLAGAKQGIEAATIANWMTGEIFRWLSEQHANIDDIPVTPPALVECIALVEDGTVNQNVGKEVLAEMLATGRDAVSIVDERGLRQISDRDALRETVRHIIKENPGPAKDYREGKQAALNYLMGQVMRETRGKANASLVRELFQSELDT